MSADTKLVHLYGIRSGVQNFPAWHTKAAPDEKCYEGYIVPSMVSLMYQLKSVLKMLKKQSCFISVTLKGWSVRKLLDPTTYIELPLCLTVHNIPGVCFHSNVSYRGGMRINGSNTTRALMGWRVDRRTDLHLLQLDHVGNERTSLVSDVKLNCIDWGYVQST